MISITDSAGAGVAAFPRTRMRRLRSGASMRRLVRETRLTAEQLVLPLFAVPGRGVRQPIEALPGQARLSPDLAAEAAARAYAAGVPAVLIFGVPDAKDEGGALAADPDGPAQRAVAAIRAAVPEMAIVTDVCLCGYTVAGHCGLVEDGRVLNDASHVALAAAAVSHAEAGADVVAPSDMMDGTVGALRSALDAEGHEGVAILGYSAKYASAFYGPFREAAGSAPAGGDRRGYQMDPANGRQAAREALLDAGEGADLVMVKPAATYLDVIARVRAATDLPLAAYHVSGEYALLKAAAERGWIDERRAALEVLTGIARAGADIVITYYAVEAAGWLAEGESA